MVAGLLSILPFDYHSWNIAPFIKYGNLALQHRGDSKILYCYKNGDEIACSEGEPEENDKIHGPGIAVKTPESPLNYYYETCAKGLKIALVYDRESNTVEEFASKLVSYLDGHPRHLSKLVNEYSNEDLPSLMALTGRGEILVLRSPSGVSPVYVGGYGFDLLIAASESSAIEILDGEPQALLNPGELLYASEKLTKVYAPETKLQGSMCIFEPLYLMRPDSAIGNVSVYEFRKLLGYELGKMLKHDVDFVVGVPETSYVYALGVSQVLGKPMEMGFIPTPGRARSMLRKSGLDRVIAIHLKMNPVKNLLEGKRIALIDDSMVTGTTIKVVSQLLRNKVGVKEIHLMIASSKLLKNCPFNYMPINERLLISLNLKDSEVVEYLEVDSVTWLDLDVLEAVSRRCNLKLCGYCLGKPVLGVR
ncbi:MAG: amidophosphoribosyltransferase [Desulfurococcaceae archaeon]